MYDKQWNQRKKNMNKKVSWVIVLVEVVFSSGYVQAVNSGYFICLINLNSFSSAIMFLKAFITYRDIVIVCFFFKGSSLCTMKYNKLTLCERCSSTQHSAKLNSLSQFLLFAIQIWNIAFGYFSVRRNCTFFFFFGFKIKESNQTIYLYFVKKMQISTVKSW